MRLLRLQPTRRTRGQAMVEFAVAFPIFIFLVMVIVDFGRGVWYNNAISNAAREGARYAIINGPDRTDEEIMQVVKDKAVGVPIQNTDIVITYPDGRAPRNRVTLEVTYVFRPITPMMQVFLPDGEVTLAAASTMILEY